MKNFLKIIITICFLNVIFLLGISKVNAAGFHGSISYGSLDDYTFTYNGLSYTKEDIFNSINVYMSANSYGSISDYKYIFIGFPTQPQASAGDTRHFIHVTLYNYDISQINFNLNPNVAIFIPNDNYNIGLKIDISTGVVSSDLTGLGFCNGCHKGWGYSNKFLTYTNYDFNNSNILATSYNVYNDFVIDTDMINLFSIDFEQGEVIIKNTSGSIANLVTYYLQPDFDDFIPDNYIFSYIENTTGGGSRESHQFNLTYNENGIIYNGKTYHYYFNLPLSYNTGLTFSIKDLENNLIQQNQFTAYLSSLIDLSGYTMYDFRNYEFADMSDINTGLFGLSYQLNTNVTINAINYNTNSKIDFLTSNYLINSHTDNNGVTWYEFNFNNEPIYLEFINNFNDSSDFYTYIDTYNLYLYFDNNAYIHLSGSPNSIETQDNIVNQSAYKDNQGNIIYNNNPIVINIDNSNEFFQNIQRYFKDFDTDILGLTGIITSPLNLIQNLLSNTCNPLVIPIPYTNSNLTLPCMSTIYSQYFGGFYTIYQDITFGVIAYWVIVRILNMVKDFRNPEHDEIEVLDL